MGLRWGLPPEATPLTPQQSSHLNGQGNYHNRAIHRRQAINRWHTPAISPLQCLPPACLHSLQHTQRCRSLYRTHDAPSGLPRTEMDAAKESNERVNYRQKDQQQKMRGVLNRTQNEHH